MTFPCMLAVYDFQIYQGTEWVKANTGWIDVSRTQIERLRTWSTFIYLYTFERPHNGADEPDEKNEPCQPLLEVWNTLESPAHPHVYKPGSVKQDKKAQCVVEISLRRQMLFLISLKNTLHMTLEQSLSYQSLSSHLDKQANSTSLCNAEHWN